MTVRKIKFKDLDGNAIISLLSLGNIEVLDYVYDKYKPMYLLWARKRFPTINQQDILDSWHDSVIAFYEQVISNSLVNLNCTIKTYLFTIGYRSLIKKHKKIEQIINIMTLKYDKQASQLQKHFKTLRYKINY